MFKLISIDPGKCKCGLVLVDFLEKKVDQAIVLNTESLPIYVKNLNASENISKVIIGNGTTSRQNIEKLDFIRNNLIIVEEKNTTLRAKKRYFEIFPTKGLKSFLPKEIFIMNKNLDALSALIILEDYCNHKFTLSENIDIKTWLK
jgi:RNase H-fold protein (predicted Holliday junction resolvase)|tara:strand:+ start:745 stop:1182 length:438 start_codon:yes stop_codon:yes gene_type:complete